MFGMSVGRLWDERLTKEEAEKRKEVLSRTRSANSMGTNNPMFGKPAPEKSGRGFCGRWKGLSFRSLLELAFLVEFEKQNGYLPESAERRQFSVPLSNGRTYFPDFVDPRTGAIFEVKPRKMVGIPANSEKIRRAEKWFDVFMVVTEELLDYDSIIRELHLLDDLWMHRAPKSYHKAVAQSLTTA